MTMMTFEEAAQRFHESGMRMTRPRQILLRLVLDNAQPFSVESLHEQAQQAGLECSLSTVYRNLDAFVTAGMVDALPGEDNRLYLWHNAQEAGAHVFCLDCRRLTPLAGIIGVDPQPDDALSRALAQRGFDASSMRMMLAAHCKTQECASQDTDGA